MPSIGGKYWAGTQFQSIINFERAITKYILCSGFCQEQFTKFGKQSFLLYQIGDTDEAP